MKKIDAKNLSTQEMYSLLIACISPRPIALVSTINKENVNNLAPFSSYNLVCSNPATLSFSIAYKKDGTEKDTLKNIREIPELVVNSVSSSMLHETEKCSAELNSELSEFDYSKLTKIPSELVKPARVRESLIQMECKLTNIIPVGKLESGGANLILAEILMFHIAEELYLNSKLNPLAIKNLARIGGKYYVEQGEFKLATLNK